MPSVHRKHLRQSCPQSCSKPSITDPTLPDLSAKASADSREPRQRATSDSVTSGISYERTADDISASFATSRWTTPGPEAQLATFATHHNKVLRLARWPSRVVEVEAHDVAIESESVAFKTFPSSDVPPADGAKVTQEHNQLQADLFWLSAFFANSVWLLWA